MQLPQALLQSLQGVKGFKEEAFKTIHEGGEQIVSIRCNPGKSFSNKNYQLTQVPWCKNGYYLQQRPSFTLDPLFHAGTYYVQEASSMFLEQALQQTVDLSKPIKVLDLCAAPGGKSTLIQSLINAESFLVSNEVIKTRVNILSENITKWGADNVIVTNNDPKDFIKLPDYFDVIIIDAPCSGSGLFRKDEKAIAEWSEANVEMCSQRQQRIIADVYDSLKKEGILIYSTCSYSKQENEDVLDWIVDEFDVSSLQLNIKEEWGIIETQSDKHQNCGYRFYPDKVDGEGFYISVFKKNETTGNKITAPKNKIEKPSAKEADVLKRYLKKDAIVEFIKINNEIIALPIYVYNELMILQSLYIKKAGVKMGSVIREELAPHHELAISNLIDDSVPHISVDEIMALQYLRKQEIVLPPSNIGWALVSYQNQPLGWVKILSNRVNNYYPKEWRILNK